MTVETPRKSEHHFSSSDFHRPKEQIPALKSEFSAEKIVSKQFADQESWESGGEFPPFVHHQVLKIRKEESHLGWDIGEGLSKKDKVAFLHVSSHVPSLFCSRPSSPLGSKTTAVRSVQ